MGGEGEAQAVDDLGVTTEEVWAAWDEVAAETIPPLDDDPAHLTIKQIAARYDISDSEARRWANERVETGAFVKRMSRRTIDGRRYQVMLYWPAEDV